MAKRVVTLDIDNTAIRLVELAGRQVRRWATASLAPGLVENGIVMDPEAVGASIRGLMQHSGIHSRTVLASLSGAFAIARVITAPRASGEALEERVLGAARELCPVPLEEVYVTWRRLGAQGEEQQVLLVAVRRSVVNYHLAALQAAGLRAPALNLKGLAVAAMAGRGDALVVNLEPATIDVVLVVDGTPQVVHTTTQPAESAGPEAEAHRASLTVARALEFYESRYPDRALSPELPIVIAGQGAADPDLARLLETRTGRPVAVLDPPVDCPRQLLKPQWSVNIGLAFRPGVLDGRRGNSGRFAIDLREPQQRHSRFSRRRLLALAPVAAGILVAFLLFQALSGARDETAALTAQRDALQTRGQAGQRALTRRAELQRATSDFQEISARRGVLRGDWRLLEETAGPGVTLTSLNLGEEGAAIQVTADSLEKVRQFVERLRQLPRFASVLLPGERGGANPGDAVSLGVIATYAVRQQPAAEPPQGKR